MVLRRRLGVAPSSRPRVPEAAKPAGERPAPSSNRVAARCPRASSASQCPYTVRPEDPLGWVKTELSPRGPAGQPLRGPRVSRPGGHADGLGGGPSWSSGGRGGLPFVPVAWGVAGASALKHRRVSLGQDAEQRAMR